MIEFEIWKQRFIGAYAILCRDLDEAIALGEEWKIEEVDLAKDCPVESARKTWEERDFDIEEKERSVA